MIGVANARSFLPSTADAIENISTLIKNEKIDRVLVGHPLGLDGSSTAQTQSVESFAAQLRQAVDIPVELVDERYSSREAHANLVAGDMKTKEHKNYVDSEAARIFLQTYFDKHAVN